MVIHHIALLMEMKEITETLVFNSTLTRLIALEDFSKLDETSVYDYIASTSCIYSPKIYQLPNVNTLRYLQKNLW
jgi:hypothetical protein